MFTKSRKTAGRAAAAAAAALCLVLLAGLVNVPRFFEIEVATATCRNTAKGLLVSVQLLRTTKLRSNFYYFLTYDPRPTLKKVRCPVLALDAPGQGIEVWDLTYQCRCQGQCLGHRSSPVLVRPG